MIRSDEAAPAASIRPIAATAPVRDTPSTSTNRPATSGSTLHDTPISRGIGDDRLRSVTSNAVAPPQIAVGSPSSTPEAEAPSSDSAVAPLPIAAAIPPALSAGVSTSLEMPEARSAPKNSRSTPKVAAIEVAEASAKCRSQTSSDGTWLA